MLLQADFGSFAGAPAEKGQTPRLLATGSGARHLALDPVDFPKALILPVLQCTITRPIYPGSIRVAAVIQIRTAAIWVNG